MADETIKIDMLPEEAVALALTQDLLENHPEVVSAILRQHEVQPSTDPEQNVLLLAKLSAERGRFFNEDFAKGAETVGYHGTEMMPSVLAKYAARHKDVKSFQAGYFKLADLFKPKEGGTKVGNLIKNLFGPKVTTPVTPGAAAQSPAADELTKGLEKTQAQKDAAAADDKKILGLTPWIFWTALGFVILLIVVIIIIIIRASKKKKDEKK